MHELVGGHNSTYHKDLIEITHIFNRQYLVCFMLLETY